MSCSKSGIALGKQEGSDRAGAFQGLDGCFQEEGGGRRGDIPLSDGAELNQSSDRVFV